MKEPNGRIVLVTGANRGIGRAIARRFLDAGDTVVATVRGAAGEREVLQALFGERGEAASAGGAVEAASVASAGEAGSRLVVERCDVRERGQVAGLAERVRGRCGRVDVLVNNAAVFEERDYVLRADELDPELLRRTLDVNVVGTVTVCVAIVPLLPRGGRVVNVSSDLGQFGKAGGMTATMVAYSLSKAAVNAYTSALANAVRARGILVDSVHPGWVRTAMGGPNAPLAPEDGAEAVYRLATRPVGESGRFWRDGAPAPW
jgi:NAD(P)-dependent dehydrogenase (short-subunit alcohol dehydrogenase family)